MKNTTIVAFALTAALASGTAFAGSCPMSMADMDRVKGLRARGEELHKSGDHSGSVAALAEAREMLGI